ncbi:MAG TPA: hypothetical protein VFN56_03045 [Candidatus Saccharimonadales bacterium]|nr:hypothetical protein [Candidatus Saccharimonadales bacterium]
MEPESHQPDSPQQNPSKMYGKRPMWQWIVIYLIIAIVVYGIIYLLFFHHSGSSGSGY